MNYQDKEIKLDTIGFNIGPCINAAGRLDTPNRALDLLLSDDDYTSKKKANELVELNEKRKTLQKKSCDSHEQQDSNITSYYISLSTIDSLFFILHIPYELYHPYRQ